LSWQYGTIIVHALEFTKWATWTKFQHGKSKSQIIPLLFFFHLTSCHRLDLIFLEANPNPNLGSQHRGIVERITVADSGNASEGV
jgi:hypothetical protein